MGFPERKRWKNMSDHERSLDIADLIGQSNVAAPEAELSQYRPNHQGGGTNGEQGEMSLQRSLKPKQGISFRKRPPEVWRGGWEEYSNVHHDLHVEQSMPISFRKGTKQLMDELQQMASFAPRSGLKSQGPLPDWQLGESVGGHSRQVALGRQFLVAR